MRTGWGGTLSIPQQMSLEHNFEGYLGTACWGRGSVRSMFSRLSTITRCPVSPFLLSTCFLKTHQTHPLLVWSWTGFRPTIASRDGLTVGDCVLQSFQFLGRGRSCVRSSLPAFSKTTTHSLSHPKTSSASGLRPPNREKEKVERQSLCFEKYLELCFSFKLLYSPIFHHCSLVSCVIALINSSAGKFSVKH